MVRIILKTLKLNSFAKYSYSPAIYSLKDYLNQYGFYKWRYSEFEDFDVFVYIFQFSEMFQDLQNANFFHRQV